MKFFSTQKLYEKIADNEIGGFTVPAFNLRIFTFEIARLIFNLAKKQKVGVFLFEIAPSEILYTRQTLKEYKNSILRAAQKEGFKGPIFLQGDHFKIKKNTLSEREKLKKIIRQALKNNFYNIDIDASLLNLKENARITALFTDFIRKIEPQNTTVSIGGEVGVIGGKNTTIEEFEVFIKQYQKEISRMGISKGIIKLAIQTGTSHGGVMLKTGRLKIPKEDFTTLKNISQQAKKYGLAGAVQHGASTLPKDFFEKIRKTGCCEIHLATVFQNIVFDSPHFPQSLREKIYLWLKHHYSKNPSETEKQFFYRTRKYAIGPFKKEISSIEPSRVKKIIESIEKKVLFFFKTLGVENTQELINSLYPSKNS